MAFPYLHAEGEWAVKEALRLGTETGGRSLPLPVRSGALAVQQAHSAVVERRDLAQHTLSCAHVEALARTRLVDVGLDGAARCRADAL